LGPYINFKNERLRRDKTLIFKVPAVVVS
jgi:hypothetical protein